MDTVNVFAQDLRGKVKKDCPQIKGAWVEFYDDITVGAIDAAQEAQATSNISKTLELLVLQIADWNFADENGPLPISIDSLKRLPLSLIKWLSQTQADLLSSGEVEAKKKDLPKTS